MTDRPSPHQVRIVPLGGLGEIGMNCIALEHDDAILVIDCGTTFLRDNLGVEVVHSDFAWLRERAERVQGVFLTHGHEDHIGGLPYFLAEFAVPVWGPPYALGLVRRRLIDHDFDMSEVRLKPVVAGQPQLVGSFSIVPLRISHSVVDACSLCIETRAGTVLHTGDFNLDPDPPDGPKDLGRLAELGNTGVMLLMSDSTNVDVEERQGSERSVATHLRELVLGAERAVFVTLFASNLHRLAALAEIARVSGRRICLLGRSLNGQVEVATEQHLLDWPSDFRIAPEQVPELSRERLLIIAGGSQAEPESALARVAKGAHNSIAVQEGDTIILSSRIIPGKEPDVNEMICALLRRGARVHSVLTDARVHTSGHAGRSELVRMLQMVRPCCFVPVHGTLHHLLRHADLARFEGVPEVQVVENGTSLVLDRQGLRVGSRVPHGRIPIDEGGSSLEPETLHERAELAKRGMVLVSLVVDGATRPVGEPRVTASGVPAVSGRAQALSQIACDVARTARRLRRVDPQGQVFCEQIRRTVRRRILELSGARPLIEVHVFLAEE